MFNYIVYHIVREKSRGFCNLKIEENILHRREVREGAFRSAGVKTTKILCPIFATLTEVQILKEFRIYDIIERIINSRQ